MIVEPCCAHKQLPVLFAQHRNQLFHFTTSGDVTTEKFLHSVLHLAGPHTRMTIIVPTADVYLMRLLSHCLDRKWADHITLATSADQTEAMQCHLSDHLAASRFAYRHHRMLTEGMLLLRGDSTSIILQGRLLTEAIPAHTNYTAALIDENGITTPPIIEDYLLALRPKLRA